MSAFGVSRIVIAGAVLLSAACAIGAGDSVANSRCAGLSYGDAVRGAAMPIRQEPHMFAAKTREAAAAELSGGIRNQQSARSLCRHLGGR